MSGWLPGEASTRVLRYYADRGFRSEAHPDNLVEHLAARGLLSASTEPGRVTYETTPAGLRALAERRRRVAGRYRRRCALARLGWSLKAKLKAMPRMKPAPLHPDDLAAMLASDDDEMSQEDEAKWDEADADGSLAAMLAARWGKAQT